MAPPLKEQDMNQHIDLLPCSQVQPVPTDGLASKRKANSTDKSAVISRRRFIGTSAVATGGLTFAFHIPFVSEA
jgi:hypothetical protein